MVAVSMNRAELLAFVREQFSAEEIWPNALIFDHQWEVESYLEDAGWHHADDCDWEGIARDNDWIDVNDDPYVLEDAAERMGLTLGADKYTVEFEHDTQNHAGAIAYCTTGLCKGGWYR